MSGTVLFLIKAIFWLKKKVTGQLGRRVIQSVVRSHEYWDAHLRKHGCGYLKYLSNDPEASVWQQTRDGFHQIGTTRMSDNPIDYLQMRGCDEGQGFYFSRPVPADLIVPMLQKSSQQLETIALKV
jgi:hypothetical protein